MTKPVKPSPAATIQLSARAMARVQGGCSEDGAVEGAPTEKDKPVEPKQPLRNGLLQNMMQQNMEFLALQQGL